MKRISLQRPVAQTRRGIRPNSPRIARFERLEDRYVLTADVLAAAVDLSAWFGTTGTAGEEAYASNWIVRLNAAGIEVAKNVAGADSLLGNQALGIEVIRGLGLPGMVLVGGTVAAAEVQAALEAHPLVESFERDRSVTASEQVFPNDAQFGSLRGLHDATVGDIDIDAPEAWGITTGSPSVTVGVIDSGVALAHADLYLNIWINQGEIPLELWDPADPAADGKLQDIDQDGLITLHDLNHPDNLNPAGHAPLVVDQAGDGNSYLDAYDLLADGRWADAVDNEGNAFVDDLFGWDFTTSGLGDNDPADEHGHGTHVAGTVAAIGNNGIGVTGVSWSSSIMALRFLDQNRAGTLADAIAAIGYATMMRTQFGVNVPVTNNSWGYRGSESTELRHALEVNAAADMLLVAAAGNGDALGNGIDNDADPEFAFYPASDDLDSIISVAATDYQDRLARFSNFGTTDNEGNNSVDIAAPGVGILSTDPLGKGNGGYLVRSGTSMAAPHVAGVAALLWAVNPEATAAEVKAALLDPLAVVPVAELAGKTLTGGRLNALGALSVDRIAPRAAVVELPNVDGPGVTEIDFTISLTDNRALNTDSIDGDEIAVIDSFDGTVLSGITLLGTTVLDEGRRVEATYRLAAPGGAFEDGDYLVRLHEASVFDAQANAASVAALGMFNVDTTLNLLRVGTLSDGTGADTLRGAIMLSNSTPEHETIRLRPGIYRLSLAGTDENASASGDLDILDTLTIRGAGADQTIIDADTIDRVLQVHPGVTLELRDLSLTGGSVFQGAGLHIASGAVVVLSRSMIYGNEADQSGGGIFSLGSFQAFQSTIHHNTASSGGGLANGGDASLENVTISTNTALDRGSAIFSFNNQVETTHATITANLGGTSAVESDEPFKPSNTIIAANAGVDFVGAVDSQGHNLIGDGSQGAGWVGSDRFTADPKLGPLALNGGNVETLGVLTHVPLENSLALDARDGGSPNMPLDQRGLARPQDADGDGSPKYDIGAVEKYFGAIEGLRFHDLNGNGLLDPGEPGRAGVLAYLDVNANNRLDSGEPSTVTLADGSYRLDGLAPGDYVVSYLLEEGWRGSNGGFGEANELVSRGQHTIEANLFSLSPSVSEDGRYVAFHSYATNLVENDINNRGDIFVFDRLTNTIELVSRSTNGQQGNGDSFNASVSGDGQYVTYLSLADNLVPGDTNAQQDVFVYDRVTQTTRIVSISNSGSQSEKYSYFASISANGRFVTFETQASTLVPDDTNGVSDVFVFDLATNAIERVSIASNGTEGNNRSRQPSLSSDGRYIAFESSATNLLGDGIAGLFVYDRELGSLQRINNVGSQPVVSANGQFVAYVSNEFGEDNVFVFNIATQGRKIVSAIQGTPGNQASSNPALSADGRYVTFISQATDLVPGDTNNADDVFVYDTQLLLMERVSVSDAGVQGNRTSYDPAISADGAIVAFTSLADNLILQDTNLTSDVFVYDRTTDHISRNSIGTSSSIGNNRSFEGSISDNGQFVAFYSFADNLVLSDSNGIISDLFVYDREHDTIERIAEVNGGDLFFIEPTLSADGRFVAFQSHANDLVPGGTSGLHVFVFDRVAKVMEHVSIASDGTAANRSGSDPFISANGRFVAFESLAFNLVSGDTNNATDVFVFDRISRTIERVSVSNSGIQGNDSSSRAALSDNGRFVVFASGADNLVPNDTNGVADIFLFDRNTNEIERINVGENGVEGNGHSSFPSIDGSGRFVAYASEASNLVADDTNGSIDVFVFDRQTNSTRRISVANDGAEANDDSYPPALSANGRYVTFASFAENLIPDDDNGGSDVFVYDLVSNKIERVSGGDGSTPSGGGSRTPSISADGVYVSFPSTADDLVSDDDNRADDIFVVSTSAAGRAELQAAVRAGATLSNLNFGSVPLPGTIRGRLFDDDNQNGIQEANELGLQAWRVYLDANRNNDYDASEAFTITNSFGEYAFASLEPVTEHVVAVVPEQFWLQTTPRLAEGGKHIVDLKAGELREGLSFGFDYRGPDAQSVGDIRGVFFRDENRNGVRDEGELPWVGRTVYIDANENQLFDEEVEESQTTDLDGKYLFPAMPPGEYLIRSIDDSMLTQTRPLNNSLPAQQFGGTLEPTQGITVGDFNGDQYDDLAVASGDGIAILLNDLAGGYLAPRLVVPGVGAAGAYTVVAAHLDDDANLDLAFTNRLTSNLTVMLGQGDGTFSHHANYLLSVWPHGLAAADFNGDGAIDLAIGTESYSTTAGKVSLLLNTGNGSGSLAPPQVIHNPAGTNVYDLQAVQLTDDNLDGSINDSDAVDLVVVNFAESATKKGNVTILYFGSGGLATSAKLPSGNGPSGVAAADLDDDGDLDLIVSNFQSGGVSIYENLGNGSMLKRPDDLPAGTGPFAVTTADIDGDGDLDILVANSSESRLAVLRNVTGTDGQITFGPPETFGSGSFPAAASSSVVVTDVNLDGMPDIALGYNETAGLTTSGRVELFRNSVSVGGYKVTIDGLHELPSLDFGLVENNAAPLVEAVADRELIAGETLSQTIAFTDVGDPGNWTVRVWHGDGADPATEPADAMLTVTNRQFPFVHQYAAPGEYTVRLEVEDADGAIGTREFAVTVHANTLRVTQFTPTASGFEASFSAALDLSALHLYAGINTADKTPDVQLLDGQGQPVAGSVVWDAAARGLTFVKTGGVLAGGNYQALLTSAADAVIGLGGELLDGDTDYLAGGDFSKAFTVAAPARTLSLPDFARGPGQGVELGGGGGIPVTLSHADGVSSVDFILRWNPNLLNVTDIALAPGTSGWFVQTNLASGSATVTLWRNAPATAGAVELLTITANVPSDAPYRTGDLLRIESLQLDEGDIAAVADAALQKVAFLGDASGNANYLGLDPSDIARVVVGLDSGFSAYPLTDPRIIADVTQNGILSGLDVSQVSRETLFVATGISAFDEPGIAPLPEQLPPAPAAAIDPTLEVTAGLTVAPGDTVSVPIRVTDSADSLRSVLLKTYYDPAVFDVQAADIRLGAMLSGLSGNAAWPHLVSVNESAGEITLLATSATPLADVVGELFVFDLSASAAAARGASRLDIDTPASNLNGGELILTGVDADVTVSGPSAQVVGRQLFYNNSSWDGNDPAASTADDHAIATDKAPLLPGGGQASFANYSSYARGLNGVMIDIADLPDGASLDGAVDFSFAVGNDNDPSAWPSLAVLPTVSLRRGAGTGQSDRISLTWPDGTILGTWLEITVHATPRTGLSLADVFYFGNAPGETGDTASEAQVNGTDFSATRANPRGFLSPADRANPFDFDRDGRVNATDLLVVREHASAVASQLQLIEVEAGLSAKRAAQPAVSNKPVLLRDWPAAETLAQRPAEASRAKQEHGATDNVTEAALDALMASLPSASWAADSSSEPFSASDSTNSPATELDPILPRLLDDPLQWP